METWRCSEFTKADAQAACDKLVGEETSGPPQADGSMTVEEFWAKVYWPTASRRLAPNSATQYASCWRTHIQPAIRAIELQHVNKHAVSAVSTRWLMRSWPSLA